MSKHEVVMKVEMACSGCSGAVERVLSKLAGVDSFDVSLEKQQVVVKGSAAPEVVVETVKKTGKKTELVSST
ncbi:MAG: putative copper chaperone [Monoraphidium minutum]|nr:MAG: putative copper chaperone [Monoraphidium minutum]